MGKIMSKKKPWHEKLRKMIEDEIKRLTRPQVVQLELFSF